MPYKATVGVAVLAPEGPSLDARAGERHADGLTLRGGLRPTPAGTIGLGERKGDDRSTMRGRT